MNHSRSIGRATLWLVADWHAPCSRALRSISHPSQLLRRLVHVETTTSANTKSSNARQRRRSRRNTGDDDHQQQRLVDRQNIPSYKEFVHRFTVLSMYRNFFKTLRRSEVHNESELKQQIRQEFKAHSQDQDPFNIQRALQEGQRRLDELQDFTGQNHSKYEQDMQSWINIDDKEDPRGRVGQGWPWQK